MPRVLLEQLHDDLLERLGHSRVDGGWRADLLVEVHPDHVDRLLAVAGQRARDGLVEGHAEGVELGARVDPILAQHLGGHVLKRAADLPVEDLVALDRHPEVHQLRLPRLVDQDVRRLEVEVDDAEVVDVVEAGRDLDDHVVEGVPVLAVEELGDRGAVRKICDPQSHTRIREYSCPSI